MDMGTQDRAVVCALIPVPVGTVVASLVRFCSLRASVSCRRLGCGPALCWWSRPPLVLECLPGPWAEMTRSGHVLP